MYCVVPENTHPIQGNQMTQLFSFPYTKKQDINGLITWAGLARLAGLAQLAKTTFSPVLHCTWAEPARGELNFSCLQIELRDGSSVHE